jgi:hypothetical protein
MTLSGMAGKQRNGPAGSHAKCGNARVVPSLNSTPALPSVSISPLQQPGIPVDRGGKQCPAAFPHHGGVGRGLGAAVAVHRRPLGRCRSRILVPRIARSVEEPAGGQRPRRG